MSPFTVPVLCRRVILAAIVVCVAIGCGDDNNWPVTNDHPAGKIVVAFGDSLTFAPHELEFGRLR